VKIKRETFGNIVECNFEETEASELHLKYSAKFSVVKVNGTTHFYSRSRREAEIWVKAICRIVDINNGVYLTSSYSPAYNKVMEK
jgi:hypothetical protein